MVNHTAVVRLVAQQWTGRLSGFDGSLCAAVVWMVPQFRCVQPHVGAVVYRTAVLKAVARGRCGRWCSSRVRGYRIVVLEV